MGSYTINLLCIDLLPFSRDQESRETNSLNNELNADKNDVAVKSNGSDCSYVQSVESSSVKDLDSTSTLEESESRVRLQT